MITKDLIKSIFINPIKQGADTLYIVSGYATPNMASWLFKYTSNMRPIDVKLIFGRAMEGISMPIHKSFIAAFHVNMFIKTHLLMLICIYGLRITFLL